MTMFHSDAIKWVKVMVNYPTQVGLVAAAQVDITGNVIGTTSSYATAWSTEAFDTDICPLVNNIVIPVVRGPSLGPFHFVKIRSWNGFTDIGIAEFCNASGNVTWNDLHFTANTFSNEVLIPYTTKNEVTYIAAIDELNQRCIIKGHPLDQAAKFQIIKDVSYNAGIMSLNHVSVNILDCSGNMGNSFVMTMNFPVDYRSGNIRYGSRIYWDYSYNIWNLESLPDANTVNITDLYKTLQWGLTANTWTVNTANYHVSTFNSTNVLIKFDWVRTMDTGKYGNGLDI